ncbi:MAG TPA: hypothetical protein PK883_02415 [Anaerolineaceae bacterium]|nr:hypothetical protein [Anaerolineaceae bacterium]
MNYFYQKIQRFTVEKITLQSQIGLKKADHGVDKIEKMFYNKTRQVGEQQEANHAAIG